MKIKGIAEYVVDLVPENVKQHPALNTLILFTSLLVTSCASKESQDIIKIEADLSGDQPKVESKQENKIVSIEKLKAMNANAALVYCSILQNIDFINEVLKNYNDYEKKVSTGEVTPEELLFLENKKSLVEIVTLEVESMTDSLNFVEKTIRLNVSEIVESFPELKIYENLVKEAIKLGFEFRKTDIGGLKVNYSTGLPICYYNQPEDFSIFEKEISEAFLRYEEVSLTEAIRIEVDQETEIDPEVVNSTKYKERIKIFQENLEAFVEAAGKGFWLKIEAFNPSDDSFRISIFNGDFKKGEISGGDNKIFWQQQLLNLINGVDKDLDKDEEFIAMKKEVDGILAKTEFKEYPNNLEEDEKKVEVVDAVFNAIFENGLDVTYRDIRYFIDNLPIEIQIVPKEKENIILALYKKMHEKNTHVGNGIPILTHIVNNIDEFFYTTSVFLDSKNLSEKEFDDLVKNHHGFLKQFIYFLIQSKPEESLKNLDKLSNIFIQESVLSPISSGIGEKFGMTVSRFSVMDIAFKSNPSLIGEYKYLYENNLSLKNYVETIEKNMSSYSAVRSYSHDTNLSAFTMSSQAPGSLFITQYISNGLIEEMTPNMDKREQTDIRLAISRNISYGANLDENRALVKFMEGGDELVKSELNSILQVENTIENVSLIADRNFLHLAHYGQGIDAFAVEGVENAIKVQQKDNSGTYEIFDGQTQKGKLKVEQEEWLKDYLENYIKSDKPVTLLLEGHANAASFSVLLEYDKASVGGIAYAGLKSLSLTPESLAKAAIKRQKYRDKYGITEPDLILFTACEGDYVTNFYTGMNNLMDDKFSEKIVPPAIMTAAEFGENSLFSADPLCATTKKGEPHCEIPYEFLREGLDLMGGKTTYGTFFEKQYSEGMHSNQTLHYPVLRNDNGYSEWVPQNIR